MDELFVGGTWIDGEGAELVSINPATGARVWQGREATQKQVDQAIAASRSAFSSWRDVPLAERVDVLHGFAKLAHEERESLARVISLETGKPAWEALGEVDSTIAKVDISIEAYRERSGTVERRVAGGQSVVRHRPHGVLAVLGPFNFPCHLPNGHIVPALLAGNTVVFKPSELTPYCGIEMVRLWERAGLPRGVVSLVLGGQPIGAALAEHAGLDGLLFTGSAAAGRSIHRGFAERPEAIVALEMGGNNPLVVDDVDEIDAAVVIILQSAYITAGQRCTCARRLFVPDDELGEALVGRLVDAIGNLRVGAFDDPEPPFMGPVITAAAADRLLAAQNQLLDLGGKPLAQMRRLVSGTGFLSPGLIDMTKARDVPDEEHFGPLLQLFRYDELDGAIQQANATRFGLAAGLLSKHPGSWKTFRQHIRAGVVNWNKPLTGASSAAPFGGVGASGNHRPSAYYAADYCAYPVSSLEQPTLELPDSLPTGLKL